MAQSTHFPFESLEIYHLAIAWANQAFQLCQPWPKSEQFGLTSQWQRASTSIALNIAEGTSRTPKEFCHFLDIANGSCFECVAILEICHQRSYLSDNQYATCYEDCNKLSRKINAFKNSIIKRSAA